MKKTEVRLSFTRTDAVYGSNPLARNVNGSVSVSSLILHPSSLFFVRSPLARKKIVVIRSALLRDPPTGRRASCDGEMGFAREGG